MITTNRPATVVLEWERSDGIINGPYSFNVGNSPITVADLWNAIPFGSSWERVVILQPNALVSNKATFTNNCH